MSSRPGDCSSRWPTPPPLRPYERSTLTPFCGPEEPDRRDTAKAHYYSAIFTKNATAKTGDTPHLVWRAASGTRCWVSASLHPRASPICRPQPRRSSTRAVCRCELQEPCASLNCSTDTQNQGPFLFLDGECVAIGDQGIEIEGASAGSAGIGEERIYRVASLEAVLNHRAAMHQDE